MRTNVLLLVMICVWATAGCATTRPNPYEEIESEEVFSKLVTRDMDDRVYSGQIRTQTGLADFDRAYALSMDIGNIDFEKKMLIFGVTDSISTRAFRFLRQKKRQSFCLDYYDAGIRYKLRRPDDGKRYSYIQVFLLDRVEGIPHIRVKNLLQGSSKVYQ